MTDKMRHGNHFQPDNNGEKCGAAKSTNLDIPVIRQLLKLGTRTQQEIAVMFGVQRKVISDIKVGRTRRCVE